ncbi:MFS transporter [Dactylosporangium fulvum]|uniref:MFS transporter n=1 Tax=Dactylosporangium fulvum TaxID=53359 RepID=A0ABY5VVM6_9ACTN|nr:MFS transporter [Dactylosporangium fulvum]UWP81863.1 MFS transporter [Dactylosporangium fulvum]
MVPDAVVGDRLRTRWLVLGVLCVAQLVVLLDNTVLNVAVPVLTGELRATAADVQWMINAYAVVQAGLLLTAGTSADRYGRRRLLLIGLTVFGAGSLAAGLAQSAAQLIAARAGMGVGGALLMTSTLAIAMQVFDTEERPKAIGIWAAVSALGYAAGPLIGGLILAHFHWGAIFLVNLPVVAASMIAARALIPESRDPRGDRLDLPGAALSTVGMAALVYAIIAGPDHGWTSARVAVPFAGGLLAVAAFVRWELSCPHPMLDLRFFRNQRFVGAVAGVVLITFGSGGALFLLAQQLQFVRGYSPLSAGLHMAPFALSVVLLNFSGLSAALIRRLGVPLAIFWGMALLSAGFVVVALSPSGYGPLLAGLLLMGSGCALANPAIVEAIMSSIPTGQAGAGAAIDGTMTEVGTSLGIAVLGAVLHARFLALLPFAATSFPAALASAGTDTERATVRDAFSSGVATGQLAGAAAVLAGGTLAALLLRRASRGSA